MFVQHHMSVGAELTFGGVIKELFITVDGQLEIGVPWHNIFFINR